MIKRNKLKQVGHVLDKYSKEKKEEKEDKKKCPICGIEVNSNLKFCLNCDYVFFE